MERWHWCTTLSLSPTRGGSAFQNNSRFDRNVYFCLRPQPETTAVYCAYEVTSMEVYVLGYLRVVGYSIKLLYKGKKCMIEPLSIKYHYLVSEKKNLLKICHCNEIHICVIFCRRHSLQRPLCVNDSTYVTSCLCDDRCNTTTPNVTKLSIFRNFKMWASSG